LRRTLPDLHDPDLAAVKTALDEDARWFAYRSGGLDPPGHRAVVGCAGAQVLTGGTPERSA
ncbi:DUF3459 domain-containing protein, partial [Streptomyces rubiginosohelvolus]|uniref:DUF3459 domain-containing protein n=1 Tax=Streptomyces rubiginosohelvolus TaxID=67362 RepID=UPI003F4B0EB5